MALTVKQSRKILGKTSEKYSDTELELLLAQFYSLAEVIAATITGSKNISTGLDSSVRKAENKNG
jgi:hypothetical protein